MRTIKLVVIGSSGVGKTSLRGQYISGRFTTGYRATIGADFITKTLPHYSDPEESVTLQIWDTAGQERFSSLSAAFFRGADAAVLLFDVNDRKTLDALTKWWAEFKDKAPLSDDEVSDFCCVVVGNKMDLVREDSNRVSEPEALKFIDTLVPPEEPQPSSQDSPYTFNITTALPSSSIDINVNDYRRSRRISSQSHSRSRSKSLLPSGTMSSTRTGLTAYHTPSSSIFDDYESARSSPLPPSRSPSPPQSIIVSPSGSVEVRRKNSSSTNSSTTTITPSLFARTHHLCPPVNSLPSISQQQDIIAPPPLPILERRPKLFFTSAKTGLGVSDVFEYVAQRVTMRLEYQEDIEARTLHMREQSTDVIHLGLQPGVDAPEGGSKSKLGKPGSCC